MSIFVAIFHSKHDFHSVVKHSVWVKKSNKVLEMRACFAESPDFRGKIGSITGPFTTSAQKNRPFDAQSTTGSHLTSGSWITCSPFSGPKQRCPECLPYLLTRHSSGIGAEYLRVRRPGGFFDASRPAGPRGCGFDRGQLVWRRLKGVEIVTSLQRFTPAG
jgi:hypothetical protein